MTKHRVSGSRRRPCSAAECELHELASTDLCGKLIQPCCRGPRRHVGAAPAHEHSAGTGGAPRGACHDSHAEALARQELRAACVTSRTQRRATCSDREACSRAVCGGMMIASSLPGCSLLFKMLATLLQRNLRTSATLQASALSSNLRSEGQGACGILECCSRRVHTAAV